MTEGPRYLGLGVNLVGFISGKLRDLRGIRTLANELIQNADDAEGTSELCFDFCKDALYVRNDGIFRDKDFERLRDIASGGKRDEEETTGAFGIGFISVYQVTDHPELFSSGRHWIIRPETSDIEERPRQTQGTVFKLPWAFDPETPLRKQLRAEPVNPEAVHGWVEEIADSLPEACLFLKRLTKLQLCREGQPVMTVERLEDKNQILLQVNGRTQMWHMLEGEFPEEEMALRARFPQIEPKRKSKVRIALPAEGGCRGLLCACLPTQMESGLPVHINADFFPSVDRKRLQFDDDFQAEWNRAALKCAAALLASRVNHLRDHVLGHKELWGLFEATQQLERNVRNGQRDRVFAEFWNRLKPVLTVGAYVFTGSGGWATPAEVRFPQSEEEDEARPLMEQMGLTLVHPDLRSFYNLLTGEPISVRLVEVKDLTTALKKAGLTAPLALADVPSWLQDQSQRHLLWRQLLRLLKRPRGGEQEAASCAIALAHGDWLYPPASLLRADAETVALYRPLLEHPFLADCGPEANELFLQLCPELTAERAIQRLEGLRHEVLSARLLPTPAPLLLWFARRRHLLSDQNRKALRALPIFPAAAGGLQNLSRLALPGGFDDPLGLTDLIDPIACEGLEDFLRELGIAELNFVNYVRHHVIPLIQRGGALSTQQRRQLVRLLAHRLMEIETDRSVRSALATAPLIECQDGLFRPAAEVYFPTWEVRNVLGTGLHLTHHAAVDDGMGHLYRWLGVSMTARPADVLQRIKRVVAGPPEHEERRKIELIFRHLAGLTKQEWEDQFWSPLKSLPWLPAKGDTRQWFTPQQIFTVFQDYLFASQARFLDLSQPVQQAGSDLLKHLGVRSEPMPSQVIAHLLTMAQEGRTVNIQVYVYLNEHSNDPAIERLLDKACLVLPGGEYVRPDQVYWGEHPFGKRRVRLSPEFRAYTSLLARLQVREQPDHTDAIAVLREIEADHSPHQQVNEDTQAVVMHCWRLLTHSLLSGLITPDELTVLRQVRVIVNAQGVLRQPTTLYFEDKGGLGVRFRSMLINDLIVRPHDAWLAMQAAGVQPLRRAARVTLARAEAPREAPALAQLIQERKDQVVRCFESMRELDLHRLLTLQFVFVDRLVLQWSIEVQGRIMATQPEEAPAFYHEQEHILYVVVHDGRWSWAAVAREIALGAGTDEEIGLIASGIKEVLSADSYEEAVSQLSDLGFSEVQIMDHKPQEGRVAEGFGGEVGPEQGELLTTDTEEPVDETEDEEEGEQQDEEDTGHQDVPHESRLNLKGSGPMEPRKQPGQPAELGRQRNSDRGEPGQRQRYRLISYVAPGDPLTRIGLHAEEEEERSVIDEAGIERVLSFESSSGRIPELKPHNHPGYDLESLDPEINQLRYIEVKSISCRWAEGEVALSSTQFQRATELGEAYWLYVVERPQAADFVIHRIQNPAQRVTHYAFDHGWQALADQEVEGDDWDPYADDEWGEE